MPRFFVSEANDEKIVLTGENARHIGRSLRMRVGEEITVCCCGIDYNCEISRITEDSVTAAVMEKMPCEAEPNVEITLFQAIPKLDKLEFIVQKSVELGVSHIVPVLTRRCVSRPNEKEFGKKAIRLNKIAEEAAKQSGRGIIPDVSPMISYKAALAQMSGMDKTLLLYEQGGTSFGKVEFDGVKKIGVVIGSEGGFDEEEVLKADEVGAERIWLGKRILRCETAPITTLSILLFLTNNM